MSLQKFPVTGALNGSILKKNLNKCTYKTLVSDFGIPLIILPDAFELHCNYGPDRNKWDKRKWAHDRSKKRPLNIPWGKLFTVFNCIKGTKLIVLPMLWS